VWETTSRTPSHGSVHFLNGWANGWGRTSPPEGSVEAPHILTLYWRSRRLG